MRASSLYAAVLISALLPLGCGKPAKGPLGAANIDQLVDRYKQAHRNKDIRSLRSIHFLYVGKIWYLNVPGRTMGGAEEWMPALFELDLVDVEVIKLPAEDGSVSLDYAQKRTPTAENGFRPIARHGVAFNQPYKLLLLGRRPGESDGPLMEVDPSMGVVKCEGRLYLYASECVLAEAAQWVKTGRAPHYYHPPGHMPADVKALKGRQDIPEDWQPIVRPRSPD